MSYTDDEIMLALVCCKADINLCISCPIEQEKKDDCTCGRFLAEYVFNLINRRNEEHKNLQEQFRHLDTECSRLKKVNESQSAEIKRLDNALAVALKYNSQLEADKRLANIELYRLNLEVDRHKNEFLEGEED